MPHYKILVIDYEPRGVAQLRDPLQAAGYVVSVAHDGVAGMKQFEEIEPDLTLIEAMLPKKHGFEVCRDLKKTAHGANSPVVIVTSVYRGRKYRTQAFHNYHCDEFLEKPISSATLLATVERLLQDRPHTPAVPVAVPEPKPEAKAEPSEETKPTAKPEPEPKPVPAAAAPDIEDEAELEITERLDDLFGDSSDPGPKASAASAPDGENILAFDPARGRTPAADAEAAPTIPGGSNIGTTGRGPATAGAARSAHAYQPKRDQHPKPTAKSWPELRERDSRLEPLRQRPARRGRLLLLLTILVVAGISSAIFLLLHWPF